MKVLLSNFYYFHFDKLLLSDFWDNSNLSHYFDTISSLPINYKSIIIFKVCRHLDVTNWFCNMLRCISLSQVVIFLSEIHQLFLKSFRNVSDFDLKF